MSFRQILMFAWWFCYNLPLTVRRLAAKISLSSVSDWTSFCNEVILNYVYHHNTKFGGPGKEVKIDESFFGKRKYNVGKTVEGQWVFGGVERGTGRCFLVPEAHRDRGTLFAHLKEWVLPGTHIYSNLECLCYYFSGIRPSTFYCKSFRKFCQSGNRCPHSTYRESVVQGQKMCACWTSTGQTLHYSLSQIYVF